MEGKTESLLSLISVDFAHNWKNVEGKHQVETRNKNIVVREFLVLYYISFFHSLPPIPSPYYI